MKIWKKILIGLALISVVFASGIVVYMFTSGYPIGYSNKSVPNDREKIMIQSIVYDSKQNSISICAQAVNDLGSKATFNGIVFRNQSNIETVIPISDTLNGLEITTITVSLNSTLPSGTYTATLTTEKGSSFATPNFKVS